VLYNFEWDPYKAKENVAKHNVGFERAAETFMDPLAISIYDEDHSEDEDRWVTIGRDLSENVLVVIHTFQEEDANATVIRVISARKATRKEIKQYKGDKP
jgi:uncharacterized DUF497 family protein